MMYNKIIFRNKNSTTLLPNLIIKRKGVSNFEREDDLIFSKNCHTAKATFWKTSSLVITSSTAPLLCTWFSFPYDHAPIFSPGRGKDRSCQLIDSHHLLTKEGRKEEPFWTLESRSLARSHSSSFATFPTNPFVSPSPLTPSKSQRG